MSKEGTRVYYIEVLSGKVVGVVWKEGDEATILPTPDKGGKVFMITSLQHAVLDAHKFNTQRVSWGSMGSHPEVRLVITLIESSDPVYMSEGEV